MGHHTDCKNWDYDTHPDHSIVPSHCQAILLELAFAGPAFEKFPYSTLSRHHQIFRELAPVCCPELAGNYRGSDFPSLKTYHVMVGADPYVGASPYVVKELMDRLEATIANATAKYQQSQLPQPQRLLKLVEITADFLQVFLTIHPYANGNGHMARLLVWIILVKNGIWPKAWPLDASPPYYQALYDHRRGDIAPLNEFILKSIIGNSAP